MEVVLFGHSYVRDLSRCGSWDRELELATVEKVVVEFEFKAYPGKDFRYFIDHPEEITKTVEASPDIVIVILGGNSMTSALSNTQINETAAAFYTLLKTTVKPEFLKLAVQIEARFVPAGNRHGAPEVVEFNRRRQVLKNNFTNKRLKGQGMVRQIIKLGSVDFLNHPQYYRDGVHLSRTGLEIYKDAVLSGLRYALEHRQ